MLNIFLTEQIGVRLHWLEQTSVKLLGLINKSVKLLQLNKQVSNYS